MEEEQALTALNTTSWPPETRRGTRGVRTASGYHSISLWLKAWEEVETLTTWAAQGTPGIPQCKCPAHSKRGARNLAGEGAEGLGERENLGQLGSAQADHGHRAQGQRLGDNAHDGAHEDCQQVPCLREHGTWSASSAIHNCAGQPRENFAVSVRLAG